MMPEMVPRMERKLGHVKDNVISRHKLDIY